MRLGVIRIEPERLAKFLDRLLIVPCLQQRHPQMIVRGREIRTQLNRFPKLIEHQLRIVSGRAHQKSQSVVNQRIVRLLLRRVPQFADGHLKVRNLFGRIFSDDPLKLFTGRLGLVCLEQNYPQIDVRTGQVRIDTDSPFQVSTATLPIATLPGAHAKKGVRFAEGWVLSYGSLQFISGLIFLPAVPERYPQVVMGVREIGIQGDCLVELVQRSRQVARLAIDKAEQIVSFRVIRIWPAPPS